MNQFDTTLEPKKTLSNRAMMAGLYIAAGTIVLGLITYVAGLNRILMTNIPLGLLNLLVILGIMFYFINTALRLYRDEDNGGYTTIGNGIGLGTLAGLVAGVLGAIWTFIFMTYIAPDLIELNKEIQLEKFQEAGQSEEQIEKIMEMSSFMFTPAFAAIATAISSVFFGFLCGLVSGLIQKRDRPYA